LELLRGETIECVERKGEISFFVLHFVLFVDIQGGVLISGSTTPNKELLFSILETTSFYLKPNILKNPNGPRLKRAISSLSTEPRKDYSRSVLISGLRLLVGSIQTRPNLIEYLTAFKRLIPWIRLILLENKFPGSFLFAC
jgi:hypothetical protein